MERGKDFAIETTLATRTHLNVIKEAQARGYIVTLLYFWLNMPSLAVERVKLRVAAGGHNVEEKTIRRRYDMGLKHLFGLYVPACEYWLIIDNSNAPIEMVAEGGKGIITKIHNKTLYNQIISYERTRNSRA